MPPPRASSADPPQSPEQVRAAIADFLAAHPRAALLESGKVVVALPDGNIETAVAHGRCTLQMWSAERNLTRRIVSATDRGGTLRLASQRMGQTGTTLLELVADREKRTPSARESVRGEFARQLEGVLLRQFPEWKATGFRTAMDLERSFGPAYVRGSLVRGQQAWAVIAAGPAESASTIDGILTLGILWLDHCRQNAAGKRLYQGLRIIVPLGMATTTLARAAWLHSAAAKWEVYELDASGELTERDPADTGNLHTRLVHHPDAAGAEERFRTATAAVFDLVPRADQHRIDPLLRSPAELAFLVHGLEFARARVIAGAGFTRAIEVTVGNAANETLLTPATRDALAAQTAELFARRRADAPGRSRDPLFRALPERWLESVLRRDLAPLTRHLGPGAVPSEQRAADGPEIIPRLDPEHVYAQVPAVAGAGDRGLLDLLGVTADGRLAVIELKAADDLHLALQGLDYWVRVRHHHRQPPGAPSQRNEFQRHGYFTGVELSAADPRLYLVAPALHIHPATEVVLRYVSPQVEWHLLALDERWRTQVNVVWRRQSHTASVRAAAESVDADNFNR